MKVNIIGDFFSPTGYGAHTRQLAKALEREGIEVSLSTQIPQGFERMVDDTELMILKRDGSKADINLSITLPHMWKLHCCDDKPFVGFCVWEGDRVPASWLDIFLDKRVNQIWVPSMHTRTAIFNTALYAKGRVGDMTIIQDKIRIVPHGVDLNLFYPKEMNRNKNFTFVANKGYRGLNDRGGLQFIIQAFNQEFSSKEDVELIVKVNPVYANVDWKKAIEELKIKEDGGKLRLCVDFYPYNKLIELYNSGDVFISASMAEAFNLPCIEAMACGLPVITTDFGGQTDFVNKNNGWLISEGEMKEVSEDILYEGVKWKVPSIDNIRKVMREVFNDKDKLKEKKENALATAKEYTWENSAKKAIQFLKEI